MAKTYTKVLILQILTLICNSLVTLYLLLNLSNIEYGKYALFISSFFYIGLASLGIQDSVKIRMRGRKFKEIKKSYYKSRISFFILSEITASMLIFICASITNNISFILMIFLISNIPQSFINFHKELFSTTNELVLLKILELLLPLFLLLYIISPLNFTFNNFLLMNILARVVIFIYLFHKLRVFINNMNDDDDDTLSNINLISDIKSGITIFFGSWCIVALTNVELILIASNAELLGKYSIIKSIIMLTISLFIPIVLHIKSNSLLDESSIYNMAKKINIFFIVYIIFLLFVEKFLIFIHIDANLIKILILLSPIFVKVYSIMVNTMIIKENNKLYKKSTLYLLMYIILFKAFIFNFGLTLQNIIIIEFLLLNMFYLLFLRNYSIKSIKTEIVFIVINIIIVFI